MAGDVVPLAVAVVVRPDGTCEKLRIVGEDGPALAVVDTLARLQLRARRQGGRVRLEELADALAELLELTGLRRELGGEAELGEEPVGFEERVDPADPVA